ncbi:hypothetical protein M0802_005141 [Mischocyttarus mexicanus]|nr:hypothetical protein M0802_005141 [Mischocyttarus mexicanus]
MFSSGGKQSKANQQAKQSKPASKPANQQANQQASNQSKQASASGPIENRNELHSGKVKESPAADRCEKVKVLEAEEEQEEEEEEGRENRKRERRMKEKKKKKKKKSFLARRSPAITLRHATWCYGSGGTPKSRELNSFVPDNPRSMPPTMGKATFFYFSH